MPVCVSTAMSKLFINMSDIYILFLEEFGFFSASDSYARRIHSRIRAPELKMEAFGRYMPGYI